MTEARVYHIRNDRVSTSDKVVTYCDKYEGSSVSEFHMHEIAAGRVQSFAPSSVTICEECRRIAGL